MIHHGAFEHLTPHRRRRAAAPELRDRRRPGRPVLRPAAAIQGDRDAARGLARRATGRRAVDRRAAADGRSSRCARARPPGVRFVPRFVSDAELAALLPARRTSSCCRTRAPSGSTSPACSRRRSRSASRSCSATSAGSPRSPRRAPRELVPPGDPDALADALSGAARRPGARERLSAAAAAAAAGPVLVGPRRRDRTLALYASADRRPAATIGAAMTAARDRLLGLAGLLVYPRSATALLLAALVASARRGAPSRTASRRASRRPCR